MFLTKFIQMFVLVRACMELITFGLGILHQGYVPYNVSTNNDPGVGLN